MIDGAAVEIQRLPIGVPGLDVVLGGGLPEYSFNILAGPPGTGKTTLAHQIMFANATAERPALYFTVLGEPALKMLRYQQQFDFFEADKLKDAIKFVNLSRTVLEGDLDAVLAEIVREVEARRPAMVFVDSFRTVIRKAQAGPPLEMELQAFVQRLALQLTSWEATTFLIGEYTEGEIRDNPVFTVADGLFWLSQNVERNSVVRKLQIMKLRGQASVPGLHTFRISESGLQVFPRTYGMMGKHPKPPSTRRLGSGVSDLDSMLGGGYPEGDSVLIAGPSGTGKSVLAAQFIAEGLSQGESGIIVVFEERPKEYVSRAETFGLKLTEFEENGMLKMIYLRPLDLSVDETLHEVLTAVDQIGAKRVVIDSLMGFEMALAPAFRDDFRESLYRMIGSLTGIGVTVVSTVETSESFTDLTFSPHAISFLTDDILRLRYVEIDSQLRKIMVVVKMRGGDHSRDIRAYDIGPTGVIVGEKLTGYVGLVSGIPERVYDTDLDNPNSSE